MPTILSEAERCLKCKVPLCSRGCPVGTSIPQAFSLFLESRLREAGELLFNNNPLSAVCSIICPHERNCAGHCVLGKKIQPVEFPRAEQYISHFYLETYSPPTVEKHGKKVGVVGAGPAGITTSIMLALKGYQITLFEAMENIAAGDIVTGPKTVVEAVAFAKKAADTIDEYCRDRGHNRASASGESTEKGRYGSTRDG